MNMIKIISDSSADLPKELIEKYDITLVPLTVTIEGTDYLEKVDLTPQEFFTKMFSTEELPKTSRRPPSPHLPLLLKHSPNAVQTRKSFVLPFHLDSAV